MTVRTRAGLWPNLSFRPFNPQPIVLALVLLALAGITGCDDGPAGGDTDDAAPDTAGETTAADTSPTGVDDGLDGPGPSANANDTDGDSDGDAQIADYAAPFADAVIGTPVAGPGIDDLANATNGVRGDGPDSGSFDVFSLGLDTGLNDRLVLRWAGRTVLNGPGADLVVFENPFYTQGKSDYCFMDLVIVEVSRDGVNWVAFPHSYKAVDPKRYSPNHDDWVGFAGRTPVNYNVETNPLAPLGPFAPEAGGDAFDLDRLTGSAEADAIRTEGFTFVRLLAAGAQTNPATGAPYPVDPVATGPDIDGVAARYFEVGE
jgi:hypothetical protein